MTSTIYINDMQEMNIDDLENTQGGIGVLAAAAAVVAVAAVYTACYEVGKSVGQAIYYATH